MGAHTAIALPSPLLSDAHAVLAWSAHVERFAFERMGGAGPDASPHLLAHCAGKLARAVVADAQVGGTPRWTIASLPLLTDSGIVEVPGWTNGVLGIDWRAGIGDAENPCAFVISHLPTGWSICAITGNLPDVIRAADEIGGAMDWGTSTMEQIRVELADRAGEMRELIDLQNGHNPGGYAMPAGVADYRAAEAG